MGTSSKYFVADLVEEVGALPTVAAQIVALTGDPSCDIHDLCRLIQSDSVMTMRFLALANSAALSGAHEARDLRSALVRLGLRRIRNVSLFMGMHDMAPSDRPSAQLDRKEFWKFSLATASAAQELARQDKAGNPDDAWLVGILHGIGVLALDQNAGIDFHEVLIRAREHAISLTEAELEILEFHHGELGARLLRQWGLPRVFSRAIDFYGEDFAEDELDPEARQLIHTLRSAITFVRSFAFGASGDGHQPVALADLSRALDLPESGLGELASRVDREVGELSRLVGLDLDGQHFGQTLEESKRQTARAGLEGFEDSLNREKLEEELAMARQIQQHLLPAALPTLPGLELGAANHPSLQVSGDYYDVLKIKGGLVGLVIADVCGKGMPAALLASNLQASLRALAGVFPDPGALLAAVNDALCENTPADHFATLFLAVLAPDGTGFRYASAGHEPPLLLRPDGSCLALKPAGTPLGMFPGAQYPVQEVPLGPGDLVAAYTDGIIEALNGNRKEFGRESLEQCCRAHFNSPCPDLIGTVVQTVRNHVEGPSSSQVEPPLAPAGAGGRPPVDPGDDLTMVVLRRTGG